MITFLCVGKLKDINSLNLFNNYIRRIKLFYKLEIIEIKDSNQELETKSILDYMQNHSNKKYILLDEQGFSYSSLKFAEKIEKHIKNVEDVVFIISGATGILKEKKVLFKDKLSLSYLTFPHELARIILAEQVYRAFSIINKLPYHKE